MWKNNLIINIGWCPFLQSAVVQSLAKRARKHQDELLLLIIRSVLDFALFLTHGTNNMTSHPKGQSNIG